ncbi:AraC family transcriptional regulator [Flavobacterium sp. LM5]|uniref:helix-turn-helix domain-containing protein n=1 Tax=Flavobacterium sp. LM5 TaxID=1938610 RepID=UPI001CB8EDE7|nr:AraC family transcriptional regulator [Flavobacterium sp. LM5]
MVKKQMKIYIKNMVCPRCIMVVQSELEKSGFTPLSVSLGEVVFEKELAVNDQEIIAKTLQNVGFEIIEDQKKQGVEKVKNLIIDLVQNQNSTLKNTLSDYLSTQLDCDYKYITTLFTELEGTTIEKYFIAQKIEKVKELLVYNELTLSEIAFQLQYSSVAHLSNQFKSVTGLTPSYFKNLRADRRIPLDQVKA